MKRFVKVIIAVVVLLIVAAGSFLAGYNYDGLITIADPKITTENVKEKLSEIGELATMEYYYTNVGKFENSLQFRDWTIPLTGKSFMVSYDGCIKAGIDMSKVTVDVTDNTINISMPKAQILSHEIYEDSFQVFDETNNLFNPIKVEDYNSFSADQKAVNEQNAFAKGLLEQAQESAQDSIRNLIGNLGGSGGFEIVFTVQE